MDKCTFCKKNSKPVVKCEICLTNSTCDYCNNRYARQIDLKSVCSTCLKTYIPDYMFLIEKHGTESEGNCYCVDDEYDICDDCFDNKVKQDRFTKEGLMFLIYDYMSSTTQLLKVVLKERVKKIETDKRLSELEELFLKEVLPLPDDVVSRIYEYL